MPHPLEAGTIRILKPDGSTAGTGFLVSKRLALTCAHVVESTSVRAGEMILFKYHLGDLSVQKALVLENGWSLENDIAILEIQEQPPKWIHPIIMQSSQAMEGRAFQGLGYPDDGSVQTRWPQGNISGRVEVEEYANPLLQLQGREIDKGLSGSAVVDRTTRRVIGMIAAYQDINRPSSAENVRFGYAIPIETIWKVFPELEREIPPLPRRSPLVEGVHLLPHGYDFRIQNFLTEYLGTLEQPEPFGGRELALHQLNDWLDGNTQRLLLAAPAGRGKSALLVRWLDQLTHREDISLVFVPISVRFRTNLSSTFYPSLGARLAYLHGEDVPASDLTSIDIWRGLVSRYLATPLANGGKLLIVLDGLDEASDWEASADLIPADLPKNTKIVVSARYLAGDPDEESWRSRLGWQHIRWASSMTLDPLNVSEVADVLFRMGVPLDKFSERVDLVSELHRLSGGDPLLVNLYVEDLWSRGEGVSKFQPENLRSIKPGYEGYFDRWWTDQKKLWGRESPLHEKGVRLLFNLLCGALGGLTKDDLSALGNENEIGALFIEDALDALKRFVIGIPNEGKEKQVAYVLSHPKLSSYFWNRMTSNEQKEVESRFIRWGISIMQALISKNLKPASTPIYLLQYYVEHLKRTHSPIEHFLSIIDYPYWYEAWFAYEGAYGGYLKDVHHTLDKLKEVDNQSINIAGKAPFLGKQIKSILIEASLRSISGSIPTDLFRLLVKYKYWTLAQAWAYINQVLDVQQKCAHWVALLPFLDDIWLQEVLKVSQEVDDTLERATLLCALARYLPEARNKMLETMQPIESSSKCADLLCALIEFLPNDQLLQLPQMIKGIPAFNDRIDGSYSYARVMSFLVKRLSVEQLLELLEVLQEFLDEVVRASILCVLAERLPENKLEIVLHRIMDLKEITHRTRALGVLVRHWSIIAPDVLKIARTIEEDNEKNNVARAFLFVDLLKTLPELSNEALAAVRRIKSQGSRAAALVALAEFVPEVVEEAMKEIGREVMEFEDSSSWSEAMHKLSKCLPDEYLTVVINSAPLIEPVGGAWVGVPILNDLAKHLPIKPLRLVLDDARELKDLKDRAEVLANISQRLPEIGGEALKVVFELTNEEDICKNIAILAQHLSEDLLPQALQAARNMLHPKPRAKTLCALAQRMPELIPEALEESRKLADEGERAFCMSGLAGRFPNIAVEIVFTAVGLNDSSVSKDIFTGLEKHLPKEHWSLLEEVGSTNHPLVLEILARQLPEEKLAGLIEKCRVLPSQYDRRDVLKILSERLPQNQLIRLFPELRSEDNKEIYDDILEILILRLPLVYLRDFLLLALPIKENNYSFPKIYKILVQRISPEQLTEILDFIRGTKDESYQSRILAVLAEFLPLHQLVHILEEVQTITKDHYRISVLSVLSARLPSSHLTQILEEAQRLNNPVYRAELLSILSVRIPAIVNEAQSAVLEIRNKDYRDAALRDLIKYLCAQQFVQLLGNIQIMANRLLEDDLVSYHFVRQADVLVDAKALISEIEYDSNREFALKYLTHRESITQELMQIFEEVGEISDKERRQHALNVIVKCMPRVIYAEHMIMAKTVFGRYPTLVNLVECLLEGHLPEIAIKLARLTETNKDGYAYMMREFAKRFPEMADEAILVTNDDWYERYWRLGNLAEYLPASHMAQILEIARREKNTDARALLLSIVALNLPEIISETIEPASMISRRAERVRVVGNLIQSMLKTPIEKCYSYLEYILDKFSTHSRSDLYYDIYTLLPALLFVGVEGTDEEILRSVHDASKWWP